MGGWVGGSAEGRDGWIGVRVGGWSGGWIGRRNGGWADRRARGGVRAGRKKGETMEIKAN